MEKTKLTSVEIYDENIGWQTYDCPENETVEDYAKWCIGEESEKWVTVNKKGDKIRLNKKIVVSYK